MSKKPVGMAQRFAHVGQNQQVFELSNRIEELEEELRQVRAKPTSDTEKEELNRQLEALATQLGQQSGEHEIPFDQIKPDPDQPRTVFPPDLIQARAKSLREEGQLNPAIVLPKDGWYQLFDGELRWRSGPLAQLKTLRCVFLTQEALDKLDRTALFDRQLTTSIQAEKLHPFDLANGLVKLMVLQHPELEDQIEEIPNLLSAAVQRLKRNDKATELDSIRIADRNSQKNWLETAGLHSVEERWIFSTILDKQLNPISISSNVFPLLNLPSDLQDVIRKTGLEGSKILELKRLSPKFLEADQKTAEKIRSEITQKVLQDKLSLSQIKRLVNQIIQEQNPLPAPTSKGKRPSAVVKSIQSIQPAKIDKTHLVELRETLYAKLQEIDAVLST
ncbi:ParB/RepB/Spo0J family partition protein [Floridanema evergladense]|uniref:ParB/RepB/Spo0J family partition protein n=1 Tax=Floridaenema evergladense BLCC-F167 TaxID=3153639 RepID=A0ABV4WX34_9CYAN